MFLPLYLSTVPQIPSRDRSWTNTFTTEYQQDLLSQRLPSPSSDDLDRPIFLTAHGFGASPFEWVTFKHIIETQSNALVSNILLGGHSSVDALASTHWHDWLLPLVNEYNCLVYRGFKRFYLCGCSTGVPLWIHALASNQLLHPDRIAHFFSVDGLVQPKSPLLYWIPYLKYVMCDPILTTTPTEAPHWIPIRPRSALIQLMDLCNSTDSLLKQGLSLPESMGVSLFQSRYDPVVSPYSAQLLYHGFGHASDRRLSLEYLDSALHVFSRLNGRDHVTSRDRHHQSLFFSHVLDHL